MVWGVGLVWDAPHKRLPWAVLYMGGIWEHGCLVYVSYVVFGLAGRGILLRTRGATESWDHPRKGWWGGIGAGRGQMWLSFV